jgi:hypothetical protein
VLYLKLITIPGQSPTLKAQIAAEITHPARMSALATIAAWERDEKPAAIEEKWLKTALDGASGEVFAIAWAVDDGAPRCLSRTGLKASEAELLREWFELVAKEAARTLYDGSPADWDVAWCGHSIRDLHLRFLWQRCVVLGIKPPFPIPHGGRPDDARTVDLQFLWGGWDGRISLDALCAALSLPAGKLPGSAIWDRIAKGDVEDVAEAAKWDVERMRLAHRRLTFSGLAAAAVPEAVAA